jgi:hypothetical protein
MDFETANDTVHPVETQWHYDTMTEHGYLPLDKEQKGLVRQYRYQHPKTMHTVTVATGSQSDYWVDKANNEQGYWGSLKNHMKNLDKESNA